MLPFSRRSVNDLCSGPILEYGPNFHDWHNFYDPFDEIDLMAGNNLMWLHRPSLIRTYVVPRQPEKYRVTVDITGFNANSVKTDVSGLKVYVYAREEQRIDSNNYNLKEFKKCYDLPANSEVEKLTSYVVGTEQLVIEVPLKEERVLAQELYLHPVVSEDKKFVSMEFSFPEYLDPSKISVVCKDNDLIIRAEDRVGTYDKQSHFSYYKRVTMPENTDFRELKCKMDKNVLNIHAPLYDSDFKKNNSRIPISTIHTHKAALEYHKGVEQQKALENYKYIQHKKALEQTKHLQQIEQNMSSTKL